MKPTPLLPAYQTSSVRGALSSTFRACLLPGVVAALSLSASTVHGQTYTDIHDFGLKTTAPNGAGQQDGYQSQDGVAFDSAGNMYGTTHIGGQGGYGSVWEITTAGVYKLLHNFNQSIVTQNSRRAADGTNPNAGVTIDQNGNLFGTTGSGGYYAQGIVWEITSTGTYVDLHDFGGTVLSTYGVNGQDGATPTGRLTLDGNGNIYGTTNSKGYLNRGNVWMISSLGSYSDLHDFGGTITSASGAPCFDGNASNSAVVLDANGNLYGVASFGGPNQTADFSNIGSGIVWEITTDGAYHDLHDFGMRVVNADGTLGPDGIIPTSITIDANGNLFGTASEGGPNANAYYSLGMAWELDRLGVYRDLHDFGGTVTYATGGSGQDGTAPTRGVTLDSSGNVYGTTNEGGAFGVGVVWKITSGGVYHDLYDFGGGKLTANIGGKSGLDGTSPNSTVSFDTYGNIYGTTSAGGQNTYVTGAGGIVWAMGSLQSVSVSVTPISGGLKTVGTVTLGMPAPIGGTVVNLSSSDPNAAPPATVKIPAGATSVSFNILTGRVTSTINATITASQGYSTVTTPLVVTPVTLSGFSYFPNPLGGSTETINVSLNGPAPAGGLTVSLGSNSAFLTVSPTVFIPAGSTYGSTVVSIGSTTQNQEAIVTATLGSATQTAYFVIRPGR